MATKNSTSISWNVEQEEYFNWRLPGIRFNVREAKKVLATKSHKIHDVEITDIANDLLCMRPKDGRQVLKIGGIKVEWTRVDNEEVDLTVPIILAETKYGTMVIDGWHRIAKAYTLGLKTLPGVVLTKEETKGVEVS
jgi:hypothetical protein